jgi:hypothetical protein
MDRLRYEFMKSAPDSINGVIGELVRKVGLYYSNKHIDDFKAAIPERTFLKV